MPSKRNILEREETEHFNTASTSHLVERLPLVLMPQTTAQECPLRDLASAKTMSKRETNLSSGTLPRSETLSFPPALPAPNHQDSVRREGETSTAQMDLKSPHLACTPTTPRTQLGAGCLASSLPIPHREPPESARTKPAAATAVAAGDLNTEQLAT